MESQPEKKLANLPKWLNIGLAFPIIILNGWLLIQFINYFQPLVSIISIAILLLFEKNIPLAGYLLLLTNLNPNLHTAQ
ncbi:MAG: hypothetical protein ACKO86_09790, partial [Dolichospermum sp.]